MGECAPYSGGNPGIEVAPEFNGPIDLETGYQRIWDMKVGWRDVNPAPGAFDFSELKRRIEHAKGSKGSPKVLYVMGMTPQWAATDPKAGDERWGLGSASAPANMDDWAAYVTNVAVEVGKDIDAYEIWNEANLKTFWDGTPQQLAEMTKIARDIIRQYDPTAKVLSPSVTTRLRGNVRRFNREWIPALLEVGGGEVPFDTWAVHTYPAGDTKTQDEALNARALDVRAYQANLRDLLYGNKASLKKPIWDTEVNYGLAGPGPIPGTSFPALGSPRILVQTYITSQYLGLGQTFWYMYTPTYYPLLGVQLTQDQQGDSLWRTVKTNLAIAAGCDPGAYPAYAEENRYLPAGYQEWATVQAPRIEGSANRVRRTDKIRVNGTVTGLPAGYPLLLQVKRPGELTWSTVVRSSPVSSNGTVIRSIPSARALKLRWVTESGNIVSNEMSVAAS